MMSCISKVLRTMYGVLSHRSSPPWNIYARILTLMYLSKHIYILVSSHLLYWAPSFPIQTCSYNYTSSIENAKASRTRLFFRIDDCD